MRNRSVALASAALLIAGAALTATQQDPIPACRQASVVRTRCGP